MLKFRKNLIVNQISKASIEMCSLKISVPKLEVNRGKFINFLNQEMNHFRVTFQEFWRRF